MKETAENAEKLDIIWGAEAIAREINRPTRATFHMLENGLIKAARRVGGRWYADRAALHAEFRLSGAA